MKIDGISGVLLAGGQSRRMGHDKRCLTVGGSTLFQRVLSIFERVFTKTIIVVAQHSSVTEGLSQQVITDEIYGKGPIGGLHAGLSRSNESHIFLAACDMPFLQVPIIERICKLVNNADAVDVLMVKLMTGIQPMQGVYSKNCIPILEDMMRTDQLSMQKLALCSELNVKVVEQSYIADLDQNFLSFMNINTPADLEMANKLCHK